MREHRVRAGRLRPARLLIKLSFAAGCVAACASGCATQVDTLTPGDEPVAGDGGTGMAMTTAGKASNGGSGSPVAGASGGQVVNAFGGTASSGGKASGGAMNGGGAGGVAGSSVQGGSGGNVQAGASSGGNKNGGAGGQAGSGGKPSGGAGSGGSAGSGSGLACLASWKTDSCDTCSTQTQSDKLGCVQILDCYYQNSCGPATCSGNTENCGANVIAKGTAGYPIAADVYMCLCK